MLKLGDHPDERVQAPVVDVGRQHNPIGSVVAAEWDDSNNLVLKAVINDAEAVQRLATGAPFVSASDSRFFPNELTGPEW